MPAGPGPPNTTGSTPRCRPDPQGPAPVSPNVSNYVTPARPGRRRRRGSPGPRRSTAMPHPRRPGRAGCSATPPPGRSSTATATRRRRPAQKHHAATTGRRLVSTGRRAARITASTVGQEQFVVAFLGPGWPIPSPPRRQVDDRQTHRGYGRQPRTNGTAAAASTQGNRRRHEYPQPPGRPCRQNFATGTRRGWWRRASVLSRDCTARRTDDRGWRGWVCHANTSLGGGTWRSTLERSSSRHRQLRPGSAGPRRTAHRQQEPGGRPHAARAPTAGH